MDRRLDYRSLVVASDELFERFDGNFRRITQYLDANPPIPPPLVERMRAVIAFRFKGDQVSAEDKFHLLVDTGLMDMIYDSKRIEPDVALFFAATMGRSNIIDELDRRTNGSLTRFDRAMDAAAEKGRVDIMRQMDDLIRTRRISSTGLVLPVPRYVKMALKSARLGHLDAIRLLLDIVPTRILHNEVLVVAMLAAKASGHPDIFNFALSRGGGRILAENILALLGLIFGASVFMMTLEHGIILMVVFNVVAYLVRRYI